MADDKDVERALTKAAQILDREVGYRVFGTPGRALPWSHPDADYGTLQRSEESLWAAPGREPRQLGAEDATGPFLFDDEDGLRDRGRGIKRWGARQESYLQDADPEAHAIVVAEIGSLLTFPRRLREIRGGI